jgi:chemotaxis protein methyltransferase CheR
LGYLLVGHTELYSQNSNKFHIKMFEESVAYQRPENDSAQPVSEFLSIRMSPVSPQTVATKFEHQNLDELFKGNDIKMHKAALNLLRQLPSDSRIPKLGNRTASELIAQLENNLKDTD